MSKSRLQEFYKEISEDLDRTMNFWFKHSHDTEYGGFINCLGPNGEVYDDTKHVWFQGRQVWMYARLFNELEAYRKQDILDVAIKGAEFLMKHAKDPSTNKCCLSMTRDGRPIKIQRSVFSECFYTMAMSELARATKEQKYKDEAILMMDKMVFWVRQDWSEVRLGLPTLTGQTPMNSLAVPMMMLCLIDQMETMDVAMENKFADLSEWCLGQVSAHIQDPNCLQTEMSCVIRQRETYDIAKQCRPSIAAKLNTASGKDLLVKQREGKVILENVSTDGKELPGSMGRLMVPGHSIEAGWFLLQYATKRNREDIKKMAIEKFIINPFQYGWDKQFGGLYYFLDVDGHSPVQLEWNMKLWWTHNEAMVAFLMAYRETGDIEMLDKFATVFDYCYTKHVDRKNGDWSGYLNRDGTVSMDFKGGPWKGCFHVPRALLLCKQVLEEIMKK